MAKKTEPLDEEIIDELVDNIVKCQKDTKRLYDRFKDEIICATTINDVMRAKKQFLVNYIDAMPFSSDVCYFCLENDELQSNCKYCDYGKKHGICGINKEKGTHKKIPTWDKINNMRIRLMDLIKEEYW